MASGLTGNEVPLDRGCGFDSRALRFRLCQINNMQKHCRKMMAPSLTLQALIFAVYIPAKALLVF